MLDSLTIRNFRLFSDLEIEKIARVNLIVGKNNSGKSCLLDAIQIYVSNASGPVLFDLISQRDENWEDDIREDENSISSFPEKEYSIRHLFYGYHYKNPTTQAPCEIEILQKRASTEAIKLSVYPYTDDTAEDGRRIRLRAEQAEMFDSAETFMPYLELMTGDRTIPLFPLTTFQSNQYERGFYARRRMSVYTRGAKQKHIKISTSPNIDNQTASLWDNIALTELERHVIEGLRLIAPIDNLTFAGNASEIRNGIKKRVPIVSINNERLPLKNFGDGMSRVLQIMLALANLKDGVLLIDEFENGLHWSVQKKLWEAIFHLSKTLNVQVFATTHSNDCIKAFESVWQKNEELGAFHRLERHPKSGKIIASTYTLDTLSASVETDFEVR